MLQGEVVKLQEQGEENQRLKSLLDLQDKGTFPAGTDFVVARVIGKSPTRWEAWIQIDKGSADGLRVDQPVVGATPLAGETLAGKGLVGKVIEVTAHSAKVLLITDSESSVAAKIQGSRAEGIVEGSVSGRLIMDYVDRDISVDPKLVIVTSGFGGVYPADIPIGIVANVGEEDVNIYKEIEVQPFVDFRVLEEVMVLIVPAGLGHHRTYGPHRVLRHHEHDGVAGRMGRKELIVVGKVVLLLVFAVAACRPCCSRTSASSGSPPTSS